MIESVLAIWGVLTIVFVVLRLSGDPTVLMLPVGSTLAEVAQLRHQLGFDQPLWRQYVTFLGEVLTLHFPSSLRFGEPALPLVLDRLPATGELAVASLSFAVLVGGAVGMLAATHRGTYLESVSMALVVLGQAIPSFWLGLMLVLLFGVILRWLPTSGSGDISHLVMPALTLGAYSSANIARVFRSSLLEVMELDYVRTARSKGLTELRVILRHVTANALLPVVTIIGLQAGTLLGGTVVVETIFAWPGVGWLTVEAIQNQDYPVVQAAVIVVASIFVTVNLAIDLLYGFIDPRIRLA